MTPPGANGRERAANGDAPATSERLDVATWLHTFRAATPRARREELISRLNVDVTLRNLARESRALQKEGYPLVLYVIASRALRDGPPVTPAKAETRQALVITVATVFHRRRPVVRGDVARMMIQLRDDHREFLRHAGAARRAFEAREARRAAAPPGLVE